MRRVLGFSKEVFESFLSRWVYEEIDPQHNGRYWECRYHMLLTHGFILEIYSSIDRGTFHSAPAGDDSIGFLVYEKDALYGAYPLIQRTTRWRESFQARLSEVLGALPVGHCKVCGELNAVLRKNPRTHSNFPACPYWPHEERGPRRVSLSGGSSIIRRRSSVSKAA